MTPVNAPPLWASPVFWKKTAIWVTAASLSLLVILTLDTLSQTQAGGKRVPDYTVINQAIDYQLDTRTQRYQPVIGGEAPLFGVALSAEDARELVSLGKKTFQAKNCINCHTLLGNGAYFAPDLTKAWLDPLWFNSQVREKRMLAFLMDPPRYAMTFGSGRRMPKLDITETEAKGLIAFLKWTSAIDTLGFPTRFRTLDHQDD